MAKRRAPLAPVRPIVDTSEADTLETIADKRDWQDAELRAGMLEQMVAKRLNRGSLHARYVVHGHGRRVYSDGRSVEPDATSPVSRAVDKLRIERVLALCRIGAHLAWLRGEDVTEAAA